MKKHNSEKITSDLKHQDAKKGKKIECRGLYLAIKTSFFTKDFSTNKILRIFSEDFIL